MLKNEISIAHRVASAAFSLVTHVVATPRDASSIHAADTARNATVARYRRTFRSSREGRRVREKERDNYEQFGPISLPPKIQTTFIHYFTLLTVNYFFSAAFTSWNINVIILLDFIITTVI